MEHTISRHRRLYGLLRETNTHKVRHDLVARFSSGRTENSSELTDLELNELIRYLEQIAPRDSAQRRTRSGSDYRGQKMRRRILSLCYTVGWVIWDPQAAKHVVDFSRLRAWMVKYSYLHKPLDDYEHKELQTLVSQFEEMVKKAI